MRTQHDINKDILEVSTNILDLMKKSFCEDTAIKMIKHLEVLISLTSSFKPLFLLKYLDGIGFKHVSGVDASHFQLKNQLDVLLTISKNKFFGCTVEVTNWGKLGDYKR